MFELLARHRAVIPNWVGTLLRRADRDRQRQGQPGHRRPGPQLPRLLRRHPHQHARLRRTRGARRGRAADRHRRRAHLDAVPDPAARSSWPKRSPGCPASRTPRCSSPTRAPRRTRPRSWSRLTARGANQVLAMRGQLSRPLVRHRLDNRQRRLEDVEPQPVRHALPARRGPAPRRLRRPVRRRLHQGLRRRPAGAAGRRDPPRRRRLPDRRAGAGRGRLHHAAGRPAGGVQGGPGRARHPAHLRRGADRLGPDRRALLGHRRARRSPRT